MDYDADASEEKGKFIALRFATLARWFFAPLAFLVGVAPKLSEGFSAMHAELLVLVVALVVNAISGMRLSMLSKEHPSKSKIWYFSVSQVIFDLVSIFAFMLVSGQVDSLAIFFVVPIVIAMFTLGESGAWSTALTAPIFLMTATIFSLPDFTSVIFGTISFGELFSKSEVKQELLSSALLATFFVILGRFTSMMASHTAEREAELEKKNKELSVAYSKLSELDEIKSHMISVAAHQLRTPLSGLKWMLKMLSNGDVGPLNTEQEKVVGEGYESVEHLVTLVNEMLEVERIESGRVKFVFEEVDFVALVNDAIKEMGPRSQEKNVVLCVGSEVAKIEVFVDKEQIHGVIENLIDNAIKYSPREGVVDIFIKATGSSVKLSIKDHGIGIPLAEQERIFSRFYRASNAVRTETEGTGLGLSIAQSVVNRHGGKIWFQSEEGNGTTFFIELPFKSVI